MKLDEIEGIQVSDRDLFNYSGKCNHKNVIIMDTSVFI